MQVGLALPHYDFSFPDGRASSVARVVEYARRAEEAGFDSVWVSDHLFLDLAKYGGPDRRYGTPEALTLLAALASATSRIGVGSLALCAPLRPPAVIAAAAATLQDLSGGRLTLALGAGWYEPEFAAAGVPYGTTGERLRSLGRVAGRVRALLDQRAGGPEDAPAARPPIWIGGKGGPVIARLVAEHGDGWNYAWRITTDEYALRLETLARACEAADRDPATVTRSLGLYTLLASDEADLARRYEQLRGWAPGGLLDGTDLASFADGALVGTLEQCAAQAKELEAMGVDHLILGFGAVPFSLPDDEQLDLAAGLLPLLR